MRFVQIQGGDIVEGKMGAFLEWLNANEEALAAAHPDGAEYMGTYFAVASSEKSAGSVYWLVGMDSYGTQDVLAADRGELNRLINEVVGFIDLRVRRHLFETARCKRVDWSEPQPISPRVDE